MMIMVETSLLDVLFTADFLVALAVRSVVSGVILFLTSRLVMAKGGLLSCMAVAALTTVITIFVFEAYVLPLLEVDPTDIMTALKTNIFGVVLSYIMPGLVWFFLTIMILRVGPFQALAIAFTQWLLGLALMYFGVLTFLADFL